MEHENVRCNTAGRAIVFDVVVSRKDATSHPEAKLSNSVKKVVSTFDLLDSFRLLYPRVPA